LGTAEVLHRRVAEFSFLLGRASEVAKSFEGLQKYAEACKIYLQNDAETDMPSDGPLSTLAGLGAPYLSIASQGME
jgi:hypothetical protein